MAFAFNKQHPEWTTVQQLWILGQTENSTQPEIYVELTAKQSEVRPEGVERWEGSFNAFKKRLQRLTKNGIDPAINTETGQKFEFDLGTARGRYDYWIWLAQHTPDQKTRVQALQMIEKLAPQFDGDYKTKRPRLANPRNVELDKEFMVEFFMVLREEIGGLHNLPLDALNSVELKKLIKEAGRVLEHQKDGDGLQALLDGIERRSELRSQMIGRLRTELQSLTEAEIRAIEEGRDMELDDDED